MAQLREAIRACPTPWPRRNTILGALGQAVWRAMKRGDVKTPKELAQLVRRLRAALWGGELPQNARALHAWAGWTVREILLELAREQRVLQATESLLEEIRRERAEAWATWREMSSRPAPQAKGSGTPQGYLWGKEIPSSEPAVSEITPWHLDIPKAHYYDKKQ